MVTNYDILRSCPICQNRQGNVLGQFNYALFDDLKIPSVKTLIHCNQCNMMYDDVFFNEQQLKEYYSQNAHYADSKYYNLKDSYKPNKINNKNLNESQNVQEENKSRHLRIIQKLDLNPNDLVLDFGCGPGGFMLTCQEYGLKVVGIDPSEKSRVEGRKKGLIIYDSLTSFKANHPELNVTAIVLSQVIEHMLDPVKCLKELVSFFPNALFYIEVPDANYYLNPKLIRWQYMFFEHICHFTEGCLTNLVNSAGIKILDEGRIAYSQEIEFPCFYIVGQFQNEIIVPSFFQNKFSSTFLRLPNINSKIIIPEDRPLAVWGISQYAMLLIGSHPAMGRVQSLFDISPAKKGRKINGILIEDPQNIKNLRDEVLLIIPYSYAISEIIKSLSNDIKYKGDYLKI